MVVSAAYELQSFAAAILLGIAVGIIYDLVKSFRLVFEKNFIPDVLMWIISGSGAAIIWYTTAGGEIRWYMILGAFFSLVLYFLLLSRYVFLLFFFIVKKIYCFFNIILKLLLTPVKFLVKIVSVYIRAVNIKFFKKVEDDNEEEKACI
ncbi:MAG: spore cortex biosynthesis protein YabQ [Clostridia bacterium]|nr:spore cortex biosynthesis protein YabQ [Clostridia bacterium]